MKRATGCAAVVVSILFVAACGVVLWLFSQFRGWGIVFWGELGQLALILVFGYVLLRRLYRRAFSRRGR